MKLVCAWCQKAGRPALMAEVEPASDPRETHGICPEHRREMEKRVIQLRAEAEARHQEALAKFESLRRDVDP